MKRISGDDSIEGAPRELRNVFGFGVIDEFFEQSVGLQNKAPGHKAMAFYKTPREVECNSRFRPKIMVLFCIPMSPTVALATLCFTERAAVSMTGAERKLRRAARIIAVYIEHFLNKSGRLICEAMVRDWNMEDVEIDWTGEHKVKRHLTRLGLQENEVSLPFPTRRRVFAIHSRFNTVTEDFPSIPGTGSYPCYPDENLPASAIAPIFRQELVDAAVALDCHSLHRVPSYGGFVAPSLSLHVPVGAVALQTPLATTMQHARDQGHFQVEAPPWSESQSHHTHPYFRPQYSHRPANRKPT